MSSYNCYQVVSLAQINTSCQSFLSDFANESILRVSVGRRRSHAVIVAVSSLPHLSSSSSDGIETFVQHRFIDGELMSSSGRGDWSDNGIEEADELDVGDMLPTLTDVGFVRDFVIVCRSRYLSAVNSRNAN